MPRFVQCLLIVSVFLLSWLLMQAVHELGHVAAAWKTGGSVERVVLHPLAISRTDVEPNPHPLIVAWGGPIVGVLAPLVLWAAVASGRLPIAWLARFFAGFCLLANGLYIGVGSFQGIGDAGDMLRYGSPHWTLWLFGLVTAPAGLVLWNGLGPHFGIGRNAPAVNVRIAFLCAALLVLIVLLECLLSPR
jgi:Peptidase M50B-like